MKFLVMIFLLLPFSVSADWKENVIDSVLFVSGIVVSFAVHEASHELAARYYGEDLKWVGDGWVCRTQDGLNPCNNLKKVALAGNLGTAILGESLLTLPDKYKNTSFVDGMQMFNAVNPISYSYKDATTSGGYLDYRYVDNRVQAILAVHAASIGYRQFSKRLWNIAVAPRGVQFNMRF